MHVTRLSIGTDDRIQLFRCQWKEFIQVPSRSCVDEARADDGDKEEEHFQHDLLEIWYVGCLDVDY